MAEAEPTPAPADAGPQVTIVTNADGSDVKHQMPLAHARMSSTIANMLDGKSLLLRTRCAAEVHVYRNAHATVTGTCPGPKTNPRLWSGEFDAAWKMMGGFLFTSYGTCRESPAFVLPN